MIKKILFVSSLAFFSAIEAQITLTDVNLPTIGDSLNYILESNYTFDVSQSGANQTWDFSSINGTAGSSSYISNANSSPNLSIPSANIVATSGTSESYYFKSATEWSSCGNYIPNSMKLVYTDKREMLKLPITYNNSFDETFSGTLENLSANQTFARSGTINITADGYGDVVLPYGTINNTLRIKIVSIYADEFQGTTIGPYYDTTYLWYANGFNDLIASSTLLYYSGTQTAKVVSCISQDDLSSGIVKITQNKIKLYPNPTNGFVNINPSASNVSIYNLAGSLVKANISLIKSSRIDVSDLKIGVYFVHYQIEDAVITEKLIIE